MNKPLVSVLIPLYNHESFVEFAIESVMQQTYRNIELIVINDGSTDNSDDVAQKLLVKYSFQYYKQENQGLIFTIEKLRSLSRGKYISLLASDDAFVDNKIEVLVNYLENNPQYAMVYSNMYFINMKNQIIGKIKDGGEKGNIFESLLCGNFFINSLTTLINKDIFMKYNYDKGYIEDFQMWLKITKDNQIGYVDEYLALYRVGNALSLSSNISKMQKAEEEIILKYSNEPIFDEALRKWNIRWLGSFGKCNKIYAIKYFLFKNITYRNFFDLNFFKALLKLLIPCFIFKRIK
ncbi:glycosyltransferase family 2 protein [Sulfurospirillum deleyianum]|uniref:Glycosyl transferase family 2 n=1 Tax=Sulfurospirillum deleyianum (strain ATCC 51133 / DSM 6946 / 5175) TaxID=525898 RepID=D1B3X3_SULD5|nr:glycosyltransferase family 2 protein [Sulfurospirillum deleyianum]ACZ12793.1 glycosyl transferase family 2 [Sulfurospirillum deleyianum DSM 6946]